MTIFWLVLIAICIISDQLIKLWAAASLKLMPMSTIPIINNVFHLTYVENRGAAFSILQNKTIFLIIFTSIALIFAADLLFRGKLKNKFVETTVALIIAGGIANLIDRIRLGYVIDYFDFRLINFPVFNLADCFVVVGTFGLLFYELFFNKEDKASKDKSPNSSQSGGEEN